MSTSVLTAYFCGVQPNTTSGHDCRPSSGKVSPWGAGQYPLLDWHPERDGRQTPHLGFLQRGSPSQIEGEFVHLQVDGWTLIAAWDRSGDRRSGCTASFAFDALLTADEALMEARRRWPAVLARIEAHVGHPVTIRPAIVASVLCG